ncbi:NADPH:quinone reductase [Diatrype stigma]|uniref:Probable quinone oxidoreductase n=1 Tax=Diatrype stigma TaxID=117547 RepID=A0AAN9US37_9PEZI
MASIPSTMKGVIIEKQGGTEVLQYKTDLPVPEPKEGEVLVKNDYIGVNFLDTYQRSGLYPVPAFPHMVGGEAEGTIVKTGSGNVYNLKEGDKVALYKPSGAYAEYALAPALQVVKLPASLAPKLGAASILQGLTALTLIRESYPVQKGDWVLVHAAAGGMGLWLTQLLAGVGARTIGTASTAAKTELAARAGATHVINYGEEKDVKARVLELTGGQGVAAVFDGVGQATFDLSLDCLARKGSMVSFGNASGAVPPFSIARLSDKNAKLLRPRVFGYLVTREEIEHYTAELFGFLEEGKIDVHIHEVYPLSEAARAHQDLEGRKSTGKLLLDPSK